MPEDIAQAQEPERWITVHWSGNIKEDFQTTLEILASDRPGLLADVTQHLFNMHLSIHSLNSRQTKNGNAIISATITIHGKDHLTTIIDHLSGIRGILSIRRT